MVVRKIGSGLVRQTNLDVVMHNLQGERDAFQRNAFDLRYGECLHPLLLCTGVKLVADTGLRTPSTPATLPGGSAGDPLLGELCEPRLCVVVCFFDFAAIYDIDDVVDGDGGL